MTVGVGSLSSNRKLDATEAKVKGGPENVLQR